MLNKYTEAALQQRVVRTYLLGMVDHYLFLVERAPVALPFFWASCLGFAGPLGAFLVVAVLGAFLAASLGTVAAPTSASGS
jgi:hypothetical protein